MKKRIIKRKRQIGRQGKNRYRKMITVLAAALTLSLSMTLVVHGENGSSQLPEDSDETAPKTVITDIFHKHIGNASAGGGCYQDAIPHIHQGNETDGGACFGRPVYHTHQGNASDGSGCYSQPMYHTHDGDEQSGGACYTAILHVHEDDCYEEAICTVYYTKGTVLETFTKDCFEHPQATYERAEGTATHRDCGLGAESIELEYCQICGIYSPRYHGYRKLTCGLEEGAVEGYELSCGKTEQDVAHYETGCGKDDNSVDFYACTCEKQIEGYRRNCGLEESVPCGRLIVTNESNGKQKETDISVRIQDLTGGKLILSEDPFIWYDAEGNQIGQGERIKVSENGTYAVEVKLKNEDVDESGLHSRITVDNIEMRMEEETPTPAGEAPTPENKQETPAPEAEEEADREFDNENEDGTPSPVPAAVPDPEIKEPDEESGNATGGEESRAGRLENREEEATASPGASPQRSPEKLKAIEKTKTLPELSAVNEVAIEQEEVRQKDGIFANPAVRLVTIAFGAFAVVAGILLLLWYLKRSVRIYNDDGEGRLLYLGRCMVRLQEDGYAITLTEQMVERAYTNRYCIRPGLFLIGRKEGEELLVCSDTQRISVYLSREMIVVIG